MSIYEIIAYICLALSILPRIRNSKLLFWAVVAILLIVASIRGLSVGTDTSDYYNFYSQAVNTKFDVKSASEFIFAFWTYFCRSFINSYDIWMFVNYGVILGLICWVAFKHSPSLFLSLFIFITCEFYLSSFNGMREYIATAISLLAIKVLNDNESIWKCGLFVLIAFFVHNTALITVFVILINFLNVGRIQYVVIVLVSFFIGFFYISSLSNNLFVQIAPFVGRFENYLLYEGSGEDRIFISNLGVNIVFLIGSFLASKSVLKSIWFKTYFLSMVVFNLVGSMFWLTRLTDNLAVVQVVTIPLIIQSVKIKPLKYGYGILILAYCLARFYIKGLSNPDILPYVVRPYYMLF